MYGTLGSLYALYTNVCACSFVLSSQLFVSEHYTSLAAPFRPNTQNSVQNIMYLMTGIKVEGRSNFYDAEIQSRYLLE